MTIAYPIPDILDNAYQGSGWAMAAILDEQVVALRYLADVAPAIADQVAEGGPHADFFLRQWLGTTEAAHLVRELQVLGRVCFGMCSGREFIEH